MSSSLRFARLGAIALLMAATIAPARATADETADVSATVAAAPAPGTAGAPRILPEPPASAVSVQAATTGREPAKKSTGLTLPVKKAQPASFQEQQPAQPSDAERITRLQRSIEADQKQLAEMQQQLQDPASEYHKADEEFKQLDTQLLEATKQLDQAKAAGDKAEIEKRQTERTKLEEQWKLSQSRFELEIQTRKTVQEKLATLKLKVKQDQEALDKLTGKTVPAPLTDDRPPEPPAEQAAGKAPAAAPTVAPTPAAQPAPAPAKEATPAAEATPAPAAPAAAPAAPPAATTTEAAVVGAPAAAKSDKPPSAELKKAATEAKFKEAAAQEAEQAAKSVGERIDLLKKDIELERKMLATARKKADIAEQSRKALEEDRQAKMAAGVTTEELQALQSKIGDTYQRLREAQAEGRQRSGRLDELQSSFADLQAEQIGALREAEKKRDDAEAAKQKVDHLQNPFTLHNMLQWLLVNGPRILVIVIAMFVALRLTAVINGQIVKSLVRSDGSPRQLDSENRARTLVSVFQNAAKVAITGSGSLMILDTLGAPITALLGGAAVFGLAVAFGAQSLIKDYFYGFMILLEQQYMINDVIRIGEIAGQVEQITLRMTVLRDLEGNVHFVPHGQITSTTNMTHGWSRALFEVGVAYKEDTDRVVQVIEEVARGLRRDPKFSSLILENLTMLGVDSFGDSAVNLKFFIKTIPLKQWEVRREMLRRLKLEFDKQGIEIPFPHRTVYHRQEPGEELPALLRRSA